MFYDSKKWDRPKYLTARQLGVSPKVRKAFVAVHQAMLANEIPRDQFVMPDWEHKHCGTPGCMQGWAQAYAAVKFDAVPRAGWRTFDSAVELIDDEACFGELHELCFPDSSQAMHCDDPRVAREALGNWLTTGKAMWPEVLKQHRERRKQNAANVRVNA